MVGAYRAWLARQPLAPSTKRSYGAKVAAFAAWLGASGRDAADALGDPHGRDYAARDYKGHLKAVRRAAPRTVNAHLAAVDSFYRHLGLGPPAVRREDLPGEAPRALSAAEQRELLRAAERRPGPGGRDRAVVALLLFAGLRIGELAALDVDDVAVSARKGRVVVRRGKGDAFREVPLNAEVRPLLQAWLDERPTWAAAGEEALFMSRKGRRLTVRALDLAVRRLGAEAGVELSAHVLRHTFVTGLVRAGHDLVLVAEVAGHRRLETTRRYSLPTAADREAAVEGLRVEY